MRIESFMMKKIILLLITLTSICNSFSEDLLFKPTKVKYHIAEELKLKEEYIQAIIDNNFDKIKEFIERKLCLSKDYTLQKPKRTPEQAQLEKDFAKLIYGYDFDVNTVKEFIKNHKLIPEAQYIMFNGDTCLKEHLKFLKKANKISNAALAEIRNNKLGIAFLTIVTPICLYMGCDTIKAMIKEKKFFDHLPAFTGSFVFLYCDALFGYKWYKGDLVINKPKEPILEVKKVIETKINRLKEIEAFLNQEFKQAPN